VCDGGNGIFLVRMPISTILLIICKKCQKGIDNFPYRKYNYLVMQLGISKEFKKGKRRVH